MPRPTERRGETRAAADFVRGREIPGFGLGVPATLSFGEAVEARVARIDPAPIRDAALETGRTPGLDAIFLSCTKLRTPDIIDALERRLGPAGEQQRPGACLAHGPPRCRVRRPEGAGASSAPLGAMTHS